MVREPRYAPVRFLLLALLLLGGLHGVAAETEQSETHALCVHVFLDYRCGECDAAQAYIEGIGFSEVDIVYHNIADPAEHALYEQYKQLYGLVTAGFPTVFVGESYFVGLDAIEQHLEPTIRACMTADCPCPAQRIKGTTPSMPKGDFKPEQREVLDIPIIGLVEIERMPLFVMTALIAFVDGFNPCSLWVLTFLLGIIIYTGSRKKILLVGLTFLLVTTAAYGVFMLGLLNVFSYIGYTIWIKIGVALVATIFAIVNIKDYFWYKKGISFTISDAHKPSLFKRLRNIMDPNKSIASMLLATAIMALGIVLVELPCTAGFPMIWTNILAQHEVPLATFALLFALYLLIYLLDELVVFAGVAITLKASKFEEKHGRVLKLVGGLIMLALATALLFFPDSVNSVTGSLYVFGAAILVACLILLVHRRILPRFGITIGTENLERPEDTKARTNDPVEKP